HVSIRRAHLEQLSACPLVERQLIDVGAQSALIRALVGPFGPGREWTAYQAIDAEHFFFEENRLVQSPTRVEVLIECAVEAPDFDAEFSQQILRDAAVLVFGRVDRLGAAVAD